MKLKTNFYTVTLLFLMLVSKSFAMDNNATTGWSRQGNEITFTCRSVAEEIRIRVVSADGSTAQPANDVRRSHNSTTEGITFTVTPSDEKAVYCDVGNVSTDRVYFGGEQIIIRI